MRVTVSRCPRWALLRELTAALRSATHTAQPAGSLSPCVSPEQVTVLTQLCSPDHMAATSWDRGKNGAKRPGAFLCQGFRCSWLPASISACSVLWCLVQFLLP